MFVVISLLLLTVVTVLRPRWALVFVFLAFSFEQLLRTRAADVVSDGSALLPPLRFTQYVSLLLLGLICIRWITRLRVPRPGNVFIGYSLYLTANVISLSYTPVFGESMRQLIIVAMIGVTAFTFNYLIQEWHQVRLLVQCIYVGAVLHCIWALCQLFLYLLFRVEIGYYAPGMADFLKVRTFGWMFEPNWFGVFLVAIFPWFLLALDYRNASGIPTVWARIGMALLLLALLLNYSRLAWLAAALQLVLWAFVSTAHLRHYAKRCAIWSLPLLSVTILVIVFNPQGLRDSLMARIMDIALISEGRGSANLRIYTYTLLLSLFSAQPWLGYGVGTWANLIGLARIGAGPTTTYLYILVEIGLVGIMTFLVFAGAYFWSLGKGFYRSVFPYRSYVAAALISTIGLACTAWFIDIKSILSYFPLFGLYLAIARLSQVDSQEQRVESINNA